MNQLINCSGDTLRIKAPAKINLHLEILGMRSDGFHELAMVMQSIDLSDFIEIKGISTSELIISSNHSGLSLGDDNLIMKAARLIRTSSGRTDLGASIHLIKNIPIGAGLAGGSTDAAATLVGLNKLWKLNYSLQDLESMSAQLGSDVPFCISGGTQLCFGRGENLEKVDGASARDVMAIVLVKDPLVEVSTPWAYATYKKVNSSKYINDEGDFHVRRQLLRNSNWLKPLNVLSPPPLRNDLQEVVAPITPAVKNSLKFLSSLSGAVSLAMSGSGPSCFAIFPSLDAATSALENKKAELKKYGLDGWCCTFNMKGADCV